MDYVSLGKSNLLVSRTAFGAMSLHKLASQEESTALVKQAFDEGVNFFDTSKSIPESEKRLGEAIKSLNIRENVIIATKTSSHSSKEIQNDVYESLTNLNVDYIDLYQLENLSILPSLDGSDGIVSTLMNLKSSGKIRHFGITTESVDLALSVLTSEVDWETIQFPFNMLCAESIEKLTKEFYTSDIGFIAMRPLCGGLATNIPLALGYLSQFENVVPVWGATNAEELQQILYFSNNPPIIDEKFLAEVQYQRDFFN